MPTSGQHIIDIDYKKKLAASVTKELEQLSPLSGECCIYRVPVRLRQLNSKAYTPQVVSIGPIHYGNKKLKAMEEHKKRYLKDFLQIGKVSVEECIDLIQKNEEKLRNCYAETIGLGSEEFVKIMLLDATFIIMVLLRSRFKSVFKSQDRLFGKPKMMLAISFDMLMLENQLPFFIVKDVLNLCEIEEFLKERDEPFQNESFDKEHVMIVLAYFFIRRWIGDVEIPEEKSRFSKVDHLLDFLRILYTPSNSDWKPQKGKLDKTINTPCIKELHQAGIEFKVGSKENIFHINFKEGILEIPPILIADHTEQLFRNLQAFEQCHCLDGPFADYFGIMVELIKTPKDAELLIERGIIDDWMGAKRISTLFHSLDTENLISSSGFTYSSLIEDLNKYYRAPSHRWKATLRQEYFKTPWTIISVVAGGILLILTIIQAVCSILQVK